MAISAGDAVIEIGLDTKKLDSGLSGVNSKITNASQQWGRQMTIAGGVIAGAAIGVAGVSLKMAADFDSAMREVNTMMLLNEEEFSDFTKQVKDLAKSMGVDATESANALYQAISAGIPKENAIEFLEIATKAAIGGVTDTATAVDGLTTVINAFKLPMSDAQHVADIMFTTVKGGKTTMEELSASMFNVAPIAATAGISFEEVSAAIATMTKQGVPTAQATTQIRQAIVALLKPTTEMKDALDSLGYASGDALIAEKGLAGALELLTSQAGGSNEILGKMFGSVEGLNAVLALSGENAEMFTSDLAAMKDAAGAATDAFDQMEKSTARQFEKLQSQMKDIAISIGQALMPALQRIMEIVGPIITKIGAWIEKNPKLTAVILALTGALGGLLLAGGLLGPMIGGLTAALPLLGAAFTAMTGPIGIVVAAIGGLIAIGIAVWKNWDKIKDMAKRIWNGIANFFKNIWNSIVNIFKEHWDLILAIIFPPVGLAMLVSKNWGAIKEKVAEIWNAVVGFFKENWDKILAIIFPAVGLPILIARNWGTIKDKVKEIWEGVIDFFKKIPDRIGKIFEKIKDIALAPFRFVVRGIETAINWIIRQINKISVDVPDWVPFIGGKHFGFDIPEIKLPEFAEGGLIPEPTLLYGLKSQRPYAIAGEKGAEVVSPAGAGSSISVTNQFQGPWFIREEADISKLAHELQRLQDRKYRSLGISTA